MKFGVQRSRSRSKFEVKALVDPYSVTTEYKQSPSQIKDSIPGAFSPDLTGSICSARQTDQTEGRVCVKQVYLASDPR